MIYRNRKTGKLVRAFFCPAFDHGHSRQVNDVYSYRSLRDGRPFGSSRAIRASRFLELYEEAK